MPEPSDPKSAPPSIREQIEQNYARRDVLIGNRYAYYQPDLRLQISQREWALSAFLHQAFPEGLSQLSAVDVGCGTGEWLRTLINWGTLPHNLTGVDLLQSRIKMAQQRSHPDIHWHQGGIEALPTGESFHLVTAFTLFTSILNPRLREQIATDMWARVKPGGWLLVVDFRYSNPKNKDVYKLTRKEVYKWWPSSSTHYKTIMLAPPLARLMTPHSYLLAQILGYCFPFLRSHFIYAAQKPFSKTEKVDTSPLDR